MGVPKQVEAAGKRAEALQKELNEGSAPEQQPPADPGQQPVNPQDGQQSQAQPNQDVHQQTPQNAQPQNSQQQQGQQEPQPQEDWQQKYASLQGMYNSMVPKLQADVTRLQESENALLLEIQQLKEAAQRNQPDPNNGAGEIPKLNKEDLEQYGDEFGQLVDAFDQLKTNFDTVQAENQSLKDQLNNLSTNVTESQKATEATAHKNYMDAVIKGISDLGGNFEILNFDPNFLNWLRQMPIGDAETRFEKLRRAESTRDLSATMAIWSEYLKPDTQASQQEPPSNPNQQQPPQQQNFQQQPADVNQQQPQFTPNIQPEPTYTGTDTAPPAHQQTRTWNRAQINQFYADVTAGKFRGKDQEKAALEADIFAAQKEGRIVG